MLQKFKITSCAFILCLFALTLMTVSPVFAADSAAFKQCQQIKAHGKFGPMKQKKNCFRDLARALNARVGTAAEKRGIVSRQDHYRATCLEGTRNAKTQKACDEIAVLMNKRP